MTLQATAQAAFDTIQGLVPESCITIKFDGQTATAIKDNDSLPTALTDYGEQGVKKGAFRIKQDALTNLRIGATIYVDDELAWVTDVQNDPAEALLYVAYSNQKQTEITV